MNLNQSSQGPQAGTMFRDEDPQSCAACGNLQRQVSELTGQLIKMTEARDRALSHLKEKASLEQSLRDKTLSLVRSNRDLDQFASVAAHDLQEPLHSILAFLDLLHVKYGNHLKDEGLGYVERVKAAANRMQQQIQGLLGYSRFDAPISPMNDVALGPLCHSIVSDLRGKIEEVGGIVLVGDLPTIQGDAIHFRQVFQNLIQNGLKFRQPGQSPVVRIDGRLMRDRRRNGSGKPRMIGRVDVTDQGIGILPEHQDKIFGMFQRLHRHDEYEGVGIGLAVCRRIVEYYGGEIALQSIPGHGSTFTVILPEKWEGPGSC